MTAPGTHADPGSATGRIRWREIMGRWRLPALGVVLGLGLAVVAMTVMTPRYTAEVTILPGEQSPDTGIFGAFADLAIATLSPDGAQWEQHFARIVVSNTVLDALADRTWHHRDFEEPVSLARIYGIGNGEGTGRRVRQNLRAALRRGGVTLRRDRFSGFMILRVTAPGDPEFAAELANALSDELEQAVSRLQTDRAVEKRRFLEARVGEVERDLTEATAALTEFVAGNRSFAESPVLLAKHGELEREVQAETTVWIELRRQLELARLEEVRDVVVVNVLDRAEPPASPASPRPLLLAGLGFLLGLLAGTAAVMLKIILLEPRG